MIDTKQKITPANKADPTDLLLTEVELRDKSPGTKKRERTSGEVAFDRIVYTGIGFFANEVSTIVFADELQHGIGKKWFENISEWMVKNLKFKDTIKAGEHIPAQKNAANLLLYASLLITGTALVLPIKKLEDNKEHWVKKLNHMLDKGKLSPEETEARDLEVKNALACEPKQTWPSMIMGRTAAILGVLGFGKMLGAKNTQGVLNWSEKTLTGSVAVNKNRTHRYAALIGLETTTCLLSSLILELSSKVFARRGVTVRNPELCTTLVHEPHGPVSDSYNAEGSASSDSEGKNESEVKQPAVIVPQEADKFAHLKKKPFTKGQTHVDAAKASETSFSLAT